MIGTVTARLIYFRDSSDRLGQVKFSQGQCPDLSGTELSAPLAVLHETQPLSPCGTAPLKGELILGAEGWLEFGYRRC
jgi:hypothetical protein